MMDEYIRMKLTITDFQNETASKVCVGWIRDNFDKEERFRLTLKGFEDDREIDVTSGMDSMSHQDLIGFIEKLPLWASLVFE